MSCIKFLFPVVLLLAGCASAPPEESTPEKTETGAPAQSAVAEDIRLYRDALSALNDNQLERAEATLTTLISRRAELAGPWANLGLIYIRKNNLPKAEESLTHALERNPQMAQAYNLLGYIEKKKGNINKAKDYYLQAIANKPDYANAHYNVALLYDIYLQDVPSAIKHYKQYLVITNHQDKQTADWVIELENSLTRGAS